MLGNKDAAANIAVRNLETARKFYEGTLGLMRVGSEGEELIAYRSGNSTILFLSVQFSRNQGDGGDLDSGR
jgi:catechol 2,3-dioxygenase-like lactoylglutathione lyase family enzyme